jgi:D-glycerate 3-kinase
LIEKFIRVHQLPAAFRELAEGFYRPLAGQVAKRVMCGDVRVLGVSGAQGSGKSTFAEYVAELLRRDQGLTVVCLSLDDFYLTKAERELLVQQVHPLLATRGVPGTHDVQLASNVITGLLAGESVAIPRFDKSTDDRVCAERFEISDGKVDLIILEGWCVGARTQPQEALEEPINELERLEDANASWRAYVNSALASQYAELFSQIDYLILLHAPNFECVYQWRRMQEQKLRDNVGDKMELMDDQSLHRFIMHYERITRACLSELPAIADAVLELNLEHGVDSLSYKDCQAS